MLPSPRFNLARGLATLLVLRPELSRLRLPCMYDTSIGSRSSRSLSLSLSHSHMLSSRAASRCRHLSSPRGVGPPFVMSSSPVLCRIALSLRPVIASLLHVFLFELCALAFVCVCSRVPSSSRALICSRSRSHVKFAIDLVFVVSLPRVRPLSHYSYTIIITIIDWHFPVMDGSYSRA